MGEAAVDLTAQARVVTMKPTSASADVVTLPGVVPGSRKPEKSLSDRRMPYARSFLADQLGEAKRKVEESERALNAYARLAGIIRTPGGNEGDGKAGGSGSVIGDSLEQLNAAANEATARRIES